MRIPTKIQHGDKVISTVYAKINGIIDYLNASRVKQGTGIRVQETPSGTVVSSVPNSVTPPQLQPAATVSGSCIPDYSNPTSISENTQYGPFTEPVWIIGSIGALLYNSALFEAYLTIRNTSITLIDITQSNTDKGFQITQLIVPVSMLIPASTTFMLETQTTSPSDFDIRLNYYPCI